MGIFHKVLEQSDKDISYKNYIIYKMV